MYESLCRPDRPANADRDRKPFVAGLLSLLLPGLGQLYNRQLFKGIVLIVVVALVCSLLAATWLLLHLLLPDQGDGWSVKIGRFFLRAGLAAPIVGGGLWMFAVIDAVFTAAALRAGALVVRYSFRKQSAMIAAGMIPVAGMFTPGETCVAGDTSARLTSKNVAEQLAMVFIKRKVMSLLKLGLALFGLIPIIVGAAIASTWLVAFGACVVLIGTIVFLR